VVAAGVCLGAQLRHHLAVHLHAALLDQLLGLATAGHARLRQDLLQPLQLGRRTRLGTEFRLLFPGFRLGFRLVFRFGLGLVFCGFDFSFWLRVVFGFRLVFRFDLGLVFGACDFSFCFSSERGLRLAVGLVSDWVFYFSCGNFSRGRIV
jgi:hypothetical protein